MGLNGVELGGAVSGAVLVLSCYGVVRAGVAVLQAHDLVRVLQTAVFNIYPLYLLMGVFVGRGLGAAQLQRAFLVLTAVTGILTVIYVVAADRVGQITLPWAPDVPAFPQPGGGSLVILGALVLPYSRLARILMIAVGMLALLATQVRGEWLAVAVMVLIWVTMTGRLTRAMVLAVACAVILGIVHVLDISLATPRGEISVEYLLARAVAPLAPEFARSLVGSEADALAGTVLGWRLPWWDAIWNEVTGSVWAFVFGLGYGFPLADLAWYVPSDVRTPHNAWLFMMAYGGIVLVVIYIWFLIAVTCALIRRGKLAVRFGIPLVWGTVASASFGNTLETPFGAIPLYLLIGILMALRDDRNRGVHGTTARGERPFQNPLARPPLLRSGLAEGGM